MSPPVETRPEGTHGGISASSPRQRGLIGWTPADKMDRAAWVAAGRRLGALSRSSNWWVGDWLQYGTSRWGEKYTTATKITGYDTHSLENMVYVASRFPVSLRRENLSWSHHAVLASLHPAERVHWLDVATEHRLSVNDLRTELRAARRSTRVSPDHGDGQDDGCGTTEAIVCPRCGFALPRA
jgi:hypothetical protein